MDEAWQEFHKVTIARGGENPKVPEQMELDLVSDVEPVVEGLHFCLGVGAKCIGLVEMVLQ